MWCALALAVGAQAAQGQADAPQADAAASRGALDERYRIGPNDLLDIKVTNRTVLSRDNVRVDASGVIRMPLIESDIRAACLTEAELAAEIAKLYTKYLRNPQVDVFVKEYQSQPAMVIGAVNSPGQFKLQRRVRLLELLALAGGPDDKAGRHVHVIHSESTSPCNADQADGEDAKTVLESYPLTETLRGAAAANPYIRPGDVVTIPDAEQVYVVGSVVRPMTIPLKAPVTVSEAIAMAGGVQPGSKVGKIVVVRQHSGSATKVEIPVDLAAINKRRAEDLALLPNDIVNVPAPGRSIIRDIVGGLVPSLARMPVTVIR
jgi:polysaccharide biosynthesis/export protein